MKKAFFILSFICFMSCTAIADTDFTEVIKSSKMPTDAEIMEIISRFNLNAEQQKVIFKDTKKKLQNMYAPNSSIDSANADLNLYLKLMEHEVFDEFAGSDIIRDTRNSIGKLPETNKTNYSSIDLSKIKYDKEVDAAAQRKFREIGAKK